jgi:hypothetical protein
MQVICKKLVISIKKTNIGLKILIILIDDRGTSFELLP